MIGFIIFAALLSIPTIIDVHHAGIAVKAADSLRAIELLIIIYFIFRVLGFVLFGYGVAESRSNLAFGFVFRLIPGGVLFLSLVCIPEVFKKRYLYYIFLDIFLMVMMGWTGGLFDYFWLFLFRFFSIQKFQKYKYLVVILIFLCLLSAPYIYAVKFYVRWGGNYQFEYFEVLSHLISRLSFVPNNIYILQNGDEFIANIKELVLPGFSLFDSITSILPRSLLGISIDNLETLLVGQIYGSLNHGVIFYLTLPGKILASFYVSIFDFVVTIFVTCFILYLLLIMTRIIFGDKSLMPWLLISYKFFLSGNIEEPTYMLYGFVLIIIISKVKILNYGQT